MLNFQKMRGHPPNSNSEFHSLQTHRILLSKLLRTRLARRGEVGAPCGRRPRHVVSPVSRYETVGEQFRIFRKTLRTCVGVTEGKKFLMSIVTRYRAPKCKSALCVTLLPRTPPRRCSGRINGLRRRSWIRDWIAFRGSTGLSIQRFLGGLIFFANQRSLGLSGKGL